MKHTLVVFHSRSGHTRRVAQALAGRLHADIDEIATRRPRRGAWGVVRSLVESLTGRHVAIRHTAHDPSHYQLVLIGTPVWVWSLPGPVRSWVRQRPSGNARLGYFCTMGGNGAERVFAQLQAATGRAPEATMAVTEAQLADDLDPILDRFVAQLATAASGAPARQASPPAQARRAR